MAFCTSLCSPGSGVYTGRYSLCMKVYTHGVFSTSQEACLVLPCSTGVDLCGPCSSCVAPFLPSGNSRAHTHQLLQNLLPWLPISANMWSDWNGQPQVSLAGPEAETLSHSQICSGHVSSLFSRFIWSSRSAEILRLSLRDLKANPSSCYSILLQLIFLNLTENKTSLFSLFYFSV